MDTSNNALLDPKVTDSMLWLVFQGRGTIQIPVLFQGKRTAALIKIESPFRPFTQPPEIVDTNTMDHPDPERLTGYLTIGSDQQDQQEEVEGTRVQGPEMESVIKSVQKAADLGITFMEDPMIIFDDFDDDD